VGEVETGVAGEYSERNLDRVVAVVANIRHCKFVLESGDLWRATHLESD
jgi:hypothetical protein